RVAWQAVVPDACSNRAGNRGDERTSDAPLSDAELRGLHRADRDQESDGREQAGQSAGDDPQCDGRHLAFSRAGSARRPGTPSRCWRQSTSPIRARCGRAHRKPLIRLGDRPRRSVRRALLRSGLRGASPTLSLLSPVPIRAANPALRVVEDRLRITLAIDPSRPGALALLKPSGRLFRVLISPRTRVCVAKVDPDASVLRLETPATRPLHRGGDRTRNGRGEYRRPLESGRRARARWN